MISKKAIRLGALPMAAIMSWAGCVAGVDGVEDNASRADETSQSIVLETQIGQEEPHQETFDLTDESRDALRNSLGEHLVDGATTTVPTKILTLSKKGRLTDLQGRGFEISPGTNPNSVAIPDQGIEVSWNSDFTSITRTTLEKKAVITLEGEASTEDRQLMTATLVHGLLGTSVGNMSVSTHGKAQVAVTVIVLGISAGTAIIGGLIYSVSRIVGSHQCTERQKLCITQGTIQCGKGRLAAIEADCSTEGSGNGDKGAGSGAVSSKTGSICKYTCTSN